MLPYQIDITSEFGETTMKLESGEIIKELESKVEAARIEYEEARSALAVFRRLFASENQKPSKLSATENPAISVDSSGQINLSSLNLPDYSKPSLTETIREVLKKFGTQEFNVSHVFLVLKQNGTVPIVKSPKASIAQALSVLEKKGEIIRTFKGKGNVPHKFKVSTDSGEEKVKK